MQDTRWLQWKLRLLCLSAATSLSAHSTQAQTPLVGGPGGGAFSVTCPPGQLLGGVQLRVGAWIDAIRPMCRTTSVSVEKVLIRPGDSRYNPGSYDYDEYVSYPVSEATPTGEWNGGTGGHIYFLSCDIGLPVVKGETPAQRYDRVRASGLPDGISRKVVSGLYVEAEGKNTVTVDRITLQCSNFDYGEFYAEPSGGFINSEVAEKELGNDRRSYWINSTDAPTFEGPQEKYPTGDSKQVKGMTVCPVRQNGARTVAVGIHGRAGQWLDALGLICDHPVRPGTPVRPGGRVRVGDGTAPAATPRAICDLARQARARNSPAAPGLEADCVAAGPSGEVAPVRVQGRVKLDSPTPASPPRAICDLARQARARNSPAAPGLEAQCSAAGAAGETAPVKPQARVKLGGGTEAAGVAPRPICDLARQARERNSPAAPGLGQRCNIALADRGAAIAQADPVVEGARAAENGALFRQGFDIATGIFGDPALGAWGNTATGPASLAIRAGLTAEGQRGFDASVTLHFSRDYKQGPVDAGPKITANPNPVVVPNGEASGTTMISWTAAPAYTYSEIYLSVDNGEWSEFARGGDGSKATTIAPGSIQTFRMMVYEGQEGTPKIIATLTVNATN